MFVELHLLQSFGPSNLNRDDTGSPKDCEFGGARRARISSQCLKRAIRRDGEFATLLGQQGGVRTRRLIVEIAEQLTPTRPVPEQVTKVVSQVFAEGGIERPQVARGQEEEKDNTKLILFMDKAAIAAMVQEFRVRWKSLESGVKEERQAILAELGRILAASARVPDVALFGRMIEIDDKKPFGQQQLRVEAACQVAHAISTHKVGVDFDFFTAVDDLLPREQTGAGMMGTVEFNSACFYRYANVDVEQLARNLGGDRELTLRTVEAFIWAAVKAIPTGKQNSMAAQNPPSLVMAVVRERGLWSLANAFEAPVRPREGSGLIEQSMAALDAQWGKLARLYGEDGIRGVWVAHQEEGALLRALGKQQVDSVAQLIERVRAAVGVSVGAPAAVGAGARGQA